MAVVTSDFLAALLTGFRAVFVESFDAAKNATEYLKICSVFDSLTEKETYAWLGTVPKMSEWVDERVQHGLLGHDYTITNKHYEATLSVKRDALEDDKYGLIKPRVMQLAQEAARHPDELTFSLLDDGQTGLAYDGTAFFANSRTIGDSANIDNLISAAGQTEANIRTDIGNAYKLMGLYQDDRGRPMGLIPDTIVCSPELVGTIVSALKPGVSGVERWESSVIKQIIVSPWIDGDATDWYVLCTKAVLKPIFFQNRKKPEFTALDSPTSENVFMRNNILYGVDARYNVGYGDPRTAIVINAA